MQTIERRFERWPFWKRFLVVVACFAVFGLAVGVADGAVWLIELWRLP